MALVVGVDTYADSTALEAYALARGIELAGDSEVLLIKAMDYLESRTYKGEKTVRTQPLQWPRTGVYMADGYVLDSTVVPADIIRAQCQLACDADRFDLIGSGASVKSKTVGDVSVTYVDGSRQFSVLANNILAPYLAAAGFSWVTRA